MVLFGPSAPADWSRIRERPLDWRRGVRSSLLRVLCVREKCGVGEAGLKDSTDSERAFGLLAEVMTRPLHILFFFRLTGEEAILRKRGGMAGSCSVRSKSGCSRCDAVGRDGRSGEEGV